MNELCRLLPKYKRLSESEERPWSEERIIWEERELFEVVSIIVDRHYDKFVSPFIAFLYFFLLLLFAFW
jgi:hypothetical protein